MNTSTFTGLPEDIQIFQDNDLILDVSVVSEDGSVFNLSGFVGIFTLKLDPRHRDDQTFLQKETDKATEGSIVSDVGGTMQFLIDRTDTASLKPGLYYWDITIFNSTTSVKYTVLSGALRVLQPILHGVPAPTIILINPATGPAAGGTAITITGTGFHVGVSIRIGGTVATSIVRVSAIQLTCNSPAGLVGDADVVVSNPDSQLVTAIDGFTYT